MRGSDGNIQKDTAPVSQGLKEVIIVHIKRNFPQTYLIQINIKVPLIDSEGNFFSRKLSMLTGYEFFNIHIELIPY